MNILNGDSAAGLFKQAFGAAQDEVLVFKDILSCGPLKKYTDFSSWKSFRENYWKTIARDCAREKFSFSALDRDFYARFKDFKSAHEYKLWIGTGLSDQLLLVFLVHLIDFHGLDFQKLSIFQFESTTEKCFEVQGIGLLDPEQIRRHPAHYKLDEKQIKHAKFAWEAVTDSNPEKYVSFLGTGDCMPPLKRAVAYLVYRYPKAGNGLSFWDETLLRYTEKHPQKAAKIIGNTLTDSIEGLDRVGDFYLFSRLKDLGRPGLCKPLIKINALNLPLQKTEVAILPDGTEALSENINVTKENGIDDWVGGVHLDSSSGNVWVRNEKGFVFRPGN